jgi:lipid A 4'-phosphatase
MALADRSRWQRPEWRSEVICLVAIALVTAVLFASGSMDIAIASWFYRPDAADHWPLARQFPWPLLYRAATWITASLVILSLAALAASLAPARRGWRRSAVLVLLSVMVGPGLLGNAVLKDHWQHPRPRDIVEFGGPLHYVPSPLMGSEDGASFPCGHCTVGFLYGAGWWIWRRRRPVWAAASLISGLLLGLLLGVGRLAAGAHFLSDVVWSALLAFGVTHLLFYHVLRVPAEAALSDTEPAASPAQSRWGRAATIAALLGGVVVLLALFATPHGTQLTASVPLTSGWPRILEVEADTANVAIVLIDEPPSKLTIDGELHGFGLPTSRLAARMEVVSQQPPRLRYRIETHGWLTDVNGVATLRVPATAFDRVIVNVRHGNISVGDTTRSGVVKEKRLQLELHTGRGHVQFFATDRASTMSLRTQESRAARRLVPERVRALLASARHCADG